MTFYIYSKELYYKGYTFRLGTVIMKRLDELGISQMRAAKMIGMKPNGFNGIVKGRFHPSERTLFCIASTFNKVSATKLKKIMEEIK